MSRNLQEIDLTPHTWNHIEKEGLNLDYSLAIPRLTATALFQELDDTLEYFTGDLAQIKIFGKIYPLPRHQVAYGDPGISYTYSGLTVPTLSWPPPVLAIRDFLFKLKGVKYDFVLVNKYRNGNDHMGEHRDNEPELDPDYPIASVSLGQERPFVLKHKDARKPGLKKIYCRACRSTCKYAIDHHGLHVLRWWTDFCFKKVNTLIINIIPRELNQALTINLEHGSILLMNPPTNEFWYHSLPKRKKLTGARINLTFRKMRNK